MENRTFTDIDRNGVLDLMKQDAQVVDVLSPTEYNEAHIAGAINLPLEQINASTVDRLDRNMPVVLYCYDYQ